MTNRNPTNMAASVRARLMNRSRETGEDFQFLLQRYAAERLLYRLGVSPYRERFVLKGAMLFALWGGPVYRATRDLDFTAYGESSEQAVRQCFHEICTQPVGNDGLEFDPATIRVEPILDEAEYNGLRVQLEARLGSARIAVRVDVGFGNAIEPPARDEQYPTLLENPAPRIRAYPVEAVVAEKLHAVHRFGETNSRLKDFYDLYMLSQQFDFDADRLGRAIDATFARRATAIDAILPAGLSPRFFADDARANQWRAYLSRNRLSGVPADFQAVGERLRAFLGPIWEALANGSPADGTWQRGNGWSFGEAVVSPGTAARRIAAMAAPVTAPDVSGTDGPPSPPPPAAELSSKGRLGRFKPYPAYKDSGVAWLGEIPAHWEVKRLKFAAELNPSSIDLRRLSPDAEVSFVPMEAVGEYGGLDLSRTKLLSEVASGYTYFADGDIVIAKITPCFENGKGALAAGLTNGVAFGTTELHVLRALDATDRKYLFYATLSDAFRRLGEAEMYGSGGQKRVPEAFVENLKHPVPPEPEQRAIAAFLDRETAKIDELVAKKERLIELLQEKRTALITRAVTKGLDPTVPMKDSGVEWLGEIPAHWEVKRLKTFASVQLSNVDKKSVEGEENVRLCNYTDVYYHERITPELDFMAATATREQVRRFRLRAGDVLITKDSESWTDIAVPAVVVEDLPEVLCGYHLAHIRPSSDCVGAFLSRAFSAIGPRDQFHVAANGITRFGLSRDAIQSGVFAMPPLPEQRAIAAFLDRETRKIDALIAKVRDAIELLKEYRTALISAAVTGKIDVREEVA
ncbi:MAG: nucleotidyl transferase AbiEii/AbiGii toxin family protein [Limisphaera sp.]|nr:nucleotidyl transferase AbiEii/AbiGii toxin family protein [Limisphaera sp.]